MRYRYGEYDPHNVDQLAVEFVCNGTVMALNRDEITLVVTRMAGKCSSAEIARRCRAEDRQILRILQALGAKLCRHCYQLVFMPDGIVGDHIDYRWNGQCTASGRPAQHLVGAAS